MCTAEINGLKLILNISCSIKSSHLNVSGFTWTKTNREVKIFSSVRLGLWVCIFQLHILIMLRKNPKYQPECYRNSAFSRLQGTSPAFDSFWNLSLGQKTLSCSWPQFSQETWLWIYYLHYSAEEWQGLNSVIINIHNRKTKFVARPRKTRPLNCGSSPDNGLLQTSQHAPKRAWKRAVLGPKDEILSVCTFTSRFYVHTSGKSSHVSQSNRSWVRAISVIFLPTSTLPSQLHTTPIPSVLQGRKRRRKGPEYGKLMW